jgi:hypothetical protein
MLVRIPHDEIQQHNMEIKRAEELIISAINYFEADKG